MTSKMLWVRVLLLAIMSAWPFYFVKAQASPQLVDPVIEQRISQLLSQMTLEEKVAQTVHFADNSTGPGSPHADYREQTAQGHVGSFENFLDLVPAKKHVGRIARNAIHGRSQGVEGAELVHYVAGRRVDGHQLRGGADGP